jgi:hypothetical protein
MLVLLYILIVCIFLMLAVPYYYRIELDKQKKLHLEILKKNGYEDVDYKLPEEREEIVEIVEEEDDDDEDEDEDDDDEEDDEEDEDDDDETE